MINQSESKKLTPPRMIPVIVAGFNTVANHIWLILLPVMLDLLLWFAPKLSIKNLVMPQITDMTNTLMRLGSPELTKTLADTEKIWNDVLGQYSVLNALRTIPVGVPSIIARMLNQSNPIGSPLVVELPNSTIAFVVFIVLTLAGFFLGSIYFNQISRTTAPQPEKMQIAVLGRQFLDSFLMALLILVVGLFLIIPISFFLSLFSLFGSNVMQFLLLVAGFVLLWMLIPFVFSPHGVFIMQQRAVPAMVMSSRMVRLFLPGTGSFVLTCALINEGLNLLWTSTPSNSWLTLIGILAHAFVVTALLTATFIYYREGFKWMQVNMQRVSATASKRPENGGFFGGNQ
jgi:hypothetical protein